MSAISPATHPDFKSRVAPGINPVALQFFLVNFAILFLPVNWLLGTTVPAVLALAGVAALGYRKPVAPEIVLFMLAGVLVTSLIYNGIWSFSKSRTIAAIYNLMIIATTIAFMNWGYRLAAYSWQSGQHQLRMQIFRSAFIVYVVYAIYILAVAAFVTLTGNTAMDFNSLIFGSLGNLPGILGQYANNTIVSQDWINGSSQIRIHGWGAYVTDSAIQVALLGVLATAYCAKRYKPPLLVLLELSILVVIIPLGSRTVGLAYVASLLMVIAISPKTVIKMGLLLSPLLVAVLIVVLPALGDTVSGLFGQITEARAGSTEARLNSYLTAINIVSDHNVLIGLGIKPFDPFNPGIPIGSHSTVISMFTKGGLLALLMIVLFYLTLIFRIVFSNVAMFVAQNRIDFATRYETIALTRAVFIWLIWTLTEDFDAPAYPAVFAGLVIGMFWANTTRLKHLRS